jgi:hypothetical protein
LARLGLDEQRILLSIAPDGAYMAGESVQRRLEQLAAVFGRQPQVLIED